MTSFADDTVTSCDARFRKSKGAVVPDVASEFG